MADSKPKKEVSTTELDYYTVEALQTAVLTAKKLHEDPKATPGLKGKMLTIANKCQAKQLKITKFYEQEKKKGAKNRLKGKSLLQTRMVDVYTAQKKTIKEPTKDGMGGMTAAAWIADNKNTIIGISVAAMGVAGVDMILNATIDKNVVSGLCTLFMKMWEVSPAAAVVMTAGGVCALSTLLTKHFHSQSMKNKITASRLKEAKMDIAMAADGKVKEKNGSYREQTSTELDKSTKAAQETAAATTYQELLNGTIKEADVRKRLADKKTTPAEKLAMESALTKYIKETEINANIQAFHNQVEVEAANMFTSLMNGTTPIADLNAMAKGNRPTGATADTTPAQKAAAIRALNQYSQFTKDQKGRTK